MTAGVEFSYAGSLAIRLPLVCRASWGEHKWDSWQILSPWGRSTLRVFVVLISIHHLYESGLLSFAKGRIRVFSDAWRLIFRHHPSHIPCSLMTIWFSERPHLGILRPPYIFLTSFLVGQGRWLIIQSLLFSSLITSQVVWRLYLQVSLVFSLWKRGSVILVPLFATRRPIRATNTLLKRSQLSHAGREVLIKASL